MLALFKHTNFVLKKSLKFELKMELLRRNSLVFCPTEGEHHLGEDDSMKNQKQLK